MSLEQLIEHAESLYRDANLGAVREWKEKHPRSKAIGYLPMYVPREIIHAADMLSVAVVGNGELEIIRGDAYFQSYICHLPRSVIELALSGRLDALDGMLFPSTCDVVRNLCGMWQILFPDKYAKYMDHPQNFDPDVGGSFLIHEWQTLRDDLEGLEELGGVQITDDKLRASIAVFNDNRRHIAQLYAARSATPWLFPSHEVYLIMRAGNVLAVEEHSQLIADYTELCRGRDLPKRDHIRVVVWGAFCEQPSVEMIQTLEHAGCYIVDDDFLLGHRWLRKDIATEGDPMRNLATAFIEDSTPCASLYDPKGENGEALAATVKQNRADGVIFAAPSFCDPALLDQPMSVTVLEREKIPYTAFLYAENTGQFQVIREQAGTFADSIRLWGEA